jgi:prepilin peptidase CpaA
MHSIAWWPTLIVLAIATFTDLRSRRIPNWLVLPFMVSGIAVGAWQGGWHGLGHSLMGFAVGAAIYGALNIFGGMGMGDVKLVAGIGAWVGPSQLLLALLLTAMAGGLIALIWAICWYVSGFVRGVMQGTGSFWTRIQTWGFRADGALGTTNPLGRKMPFAPAIAIGTLISFFSH